MPSQPLPKPDVDALIADLGDESGIVRAKACGALGRIGPPTVPALVALLGDENGAVRAGAMNALIQMQDPTAVAASALIDAFASDDSAIRANAGWTLTVMGTSALPALHEALDDTRLAVREGARAVLRQIERPSES